MATRLLSKKGRVISYLPNLGAAVKHFRVFSSYDNQQYSQYQIDEAASTSDTQTVWPDSKLGPFGSKDRRFPLPGLVGPISHVKSQGSVESPSSPVDPDQLFSEIPSERHASTVTQFLTSVDQIEEDLTGTVTPSAADMLECAAQDCPTIMKKDFSDLFPDRNIMADNFTIITISQRTEHDMSAWTEDMEVEREQLLESFIQGATEICEALHSAGYWADFIDPSCGKPYLGSHTNTTLFETDERYRKLGFEIDDLGCCKVISHHLWGTHAYVGCLFTNAPLNHPILQTINQK